MIKRRPSKTPKRIANNSELEVIFEVNRKAVEVGKDIKQQQEDVLELLGSLDDKYATTNEWQSVTKDTIRDTKMTVELTKASMDVVSGNVSSAISLYQDLQRDWKSKKESDDRFQADLEKKFKKIEDIEKDLFHLKVIWSSTVIGLILAGVKTLFFK